MSFNPQYGEPEARGIRQLTERLKHQKKELEESLSRVNAALTALESIPELTNLIEIIERAGY